MKKIKHEAHLLFLRFNILVELLHFLLTHKLWWAIPLIMLTMILVVIFLFGQHTGVAPFLYPLF